MADAITYIKEVKEQTSDFNQRIRQTCEEMPITDVQLDLVHGQPMVTLLCEARDATEEDIEKGLVENLEEPIVEDVPLCCSVCKVKSNNPGDADKSESYLDQLYEFAGKNLIDITVKSGTAREWVELPKWVKEKIRKAQKEQGSNAQAANLGEDMPIYQEVEVNWVLVTWSLYDDPEDEAEGAEGEGTSPANETQSSEETKPVEEPKTEAEPTSKKEEKSKNGKKNRKKKNNKKTKGSPADGKPAAEEEKSPVDPDDPPL